MTGILITVVYKPLRHWVDDHPLLYGNNGNLDPSTYNDPPHHNPPLASDAKYLMKGDSSKGMDQKTSHQSTSWCLSKAGYIFFWEKNGGHWRRWGILRFPWYQFGRSVEIHVFVQAKGVLFSVERILGNLSCFLNVLHPTGLFLKCQLAKKSFGGTVRDSILTNRPNLENNRVIHKNPHKLVKNNVPPAKDSTH